MDELSPAKRRLLEKWLKDKASETESLLIPPAQPHPDGTWPLTFQQEDLFLRQWIDPEFTGFNNPKAIRMRGRLDYQALRQSLEDLVRCQAIYRTLYQFNGSEVRQRVIQDWEPTLQIEAVDSSNPLQAERQCKDRAMEFLGKPFDLTRESSLRAVLYCLAQEDHLLLIVVHHIASDLSSHGLLLQALANGYQGALEGKLPDAPLSLQYTDYAVWQRQHYFRQRESLLAFWRNHLQGVPTLLPIHAASSPGATSRATPRIYNWDINEYQLLKVDQLAKCLHCSRFTILFAIVAQLLRQLCLQDDFLLGIILNQRNRPELKPIIGDLVDMLPVRLNFTANPLTLVEVIRLTRNALLDALDHRNIPFVELVRELKPLRQEGRLPLIQAAVTDHDPGGEPPRWSGLDTEMLELLGEQKPLDLHWAFIPSADHLACTLECAAERLGEGPWDELPERFLALLDAVLAQADQPEQLNTHPPSQVQGLAPIAAPQPGHDYWIHQLRDLEPLQIPRDRPRPRADSKSVPVSLAGAASMG